MKKSIFLLALCWLSIQAYGQNVTLKGTVKHFVRDSIRIMNVHDGYWQSFKPIAAKITADSSFQLSFSIEKAKFVRLAIGIYPSPIIFVSPGDNIELEVDATAPLPLKAKGENAAHYLFDQEKNQYEKSIGTIFKPNTSGSFEDFMKSIYAFRDTVPYFSNVYEKAHPELSVEFKNAVKKWDEAEIAYKNFMRVYSFAALTKQEYENVKIHDNFFDFAQKWQESSKEDWETIPMYDQASILVIYHRLKESVGKEASFVQEYEYIQKNCKEDVRWMILTKNLSSEIRVGIKKEVLPILEAHLKNCPNQYAKNNLSVTYESKKAVLSGVVAPDFRAEDIKGKEVRLSDFKGKVVYLDFWATWCGPCIEEFKSERGKITKEAFKDKNIVFLTVCADEDKEKWLKMVEELGLKEHNTNLFISSNGFANEAFEAYQVKGIPAFFIIGEDGKIWDNYPPRPSEKSLVKSLEEVLNK